MSVQNPTISVVMPVYNAEAYVGEAIESILAQTYINLEFVIINDGSSDNTATIVKKYIDKRIKYYENDTNMGIVYTLNRGFSLARGEYIARMDADDISLPNRLMKQVAYMQTHMNVVACGTLYGLYGGEAVPVDVAVTAQDIRSDMALFCQFAHSMIMIRKSVLEEHHLCYRKEYGYAEDYKLWTELLQYGDMVNIPEILGYIRQCDEGISITHAQKQRRLSDRVRQEYLVNMGIQSPKLLNEVVDGYGDMAVTREVLLAYKPLIKKSSNHTWLKKNYVSTIKHYLNKLSFKERIYEIVCNWGEFLTVRDKVAILVK